MLLRKAGYSGFCMFGKLRLWKNFWPELFLWTFLHMNDSRRDFSTTCTWYMYMCVYVCACVCIYTYMDMVCIWLVIYIHACTHTYTEQMYLSVCVSMYMHMYIYSLLRLSRSCKAITGSSRQSLFSISTYNIFKFWFPSRIICVNTFPKSYWKYYQVWKSMAIMTWA